MDIKTDWVRIPDEQAPLEAYLACPLASGPWPGVVLFQEIFGVNSHIREVAERLARLGYVVIAPDLFYRSAPRLDLDYTEMAKGRHHKDQTTATQLLADTQAALTYLEGVARPGGYGCIGFCFGGHVAYLAATLPQIKATACFYGGGIATMTPGGGAPTLERTPEIKGRLYGFFGNQDPLIPGAEVDQIAAALEKAHVDHRIFRYDASHGFFCDRRSDYSPVAAADAWSHVQELFQTTLT